MDEHDNKTGSQKQGGWTPGPWTYRDMRPNTYGPAFVDAENVRNLAICGDAVGRSETHGFCLQVDAEERMANARLIAAAPCAMALVERIAALNPDAGEIGAGMLVQLVTEARRIKARANPSTDQGEG